MNLCEFAARLAYIDSSRTARAVRQGNPVLNTKRTTKKENPKILSQAYQIKDTQSAFPSLSY